MKKKKCSTCRYAFTVDVGYSNYSVEGTDLYCVADVFPDQGVDVYYDAEPSLEFAEQCDWYTYTDKQVAFDVDFEDNWGMYFDGVSPTRKLIIEIWIDRYKKDEDIRYLAECKSEYYNRR